MRDAVYIVVILAILIASSAALVWQDRKIKSYDTIITEKNSKIEYFMNENGKLIAGKDAAELAVKDLKKYYPEIYRSLSRDLDVKVRDLKAYMESEFRSTGSGKAEVHNHYNTYNKSKFTEMTAGDGYLSFSGILVDSLSSSYTYTYTDTIKQSISVRKDWLFGSERLYGSATLSNPNAKILSSKNILINEYRDKRFSVGIGALYDPSVNKFRLGVGVNYALFKF